MFLHRILPDSVVKANDAAQVAKYAPLTTEVNGQLVAGRETSKCQLALSLADPQAGRTSRVHAKFEFKPATGHAFVEDLGSTNGTYINEAQMSGRHPLKNGDAVALGMAAWRVEISDGSQTSATEQTMMGMPSLDASMSDVSIHDLPNDDGDAGKSMIG